MKKYILILAYSIFLISCNQKKDIEDAQNWLNKNLNEYYLQNLDENKIFSKEFKEVLNDLTPFIISENEQLISATEFKSKWEKKYDVNKLNTLFPPYTDFQKISIESKFQEIENDSVFVFEVKNYGIIDQKKELFCERIIKLVKNKDDFLISEVNSKEKNHLDEVIFAEIESKKTPKCKDGIEMSKQLISDYLSKITIGLKSTITHSDGRLMIPTDEEIKKLAFEYISIDNIRTIDKNDETLSCDCSASIKFNFPFLQNVKNYEVYQTLNLYQQGNLNYDYSLFKNDDYQLNIEGYLPQKELRQLLFILHSNNINNK